MRAEQLCPVCREPVSVEQAGEFLPCCGPKCDREARKRRAELRRETEGDDG
jgi:hypothetical protein